MASKNGGMDFQSPSHAPSIAASSLKVCAISAAQRSDVEGLHIDNTAADGLGAGRCGLGGQVVGFDPVVFFLSNENAPLFTAPSPRLFQILGDTEIAVSDPVTRDDAPDFVRLLLELPAYEDA